MPPEKVPDYLDIIQQKANRLTDLIESFHEYSKLEHPQFTLRTEPMDLCEVLREYLADKYSELELAGFVPQIDIPAVSYTHLQQGGGREREGGRRGEKRRRDLHAGRHGHPPGHSGQGKGTERRKAAAEAVSYTHLTAAEEVGLGRCHNLAPALRLLNCAFI